MSAEQRQHITEAVERWSREHFGQAWAWPVTIREMDGLHAGNGASYEVWVELPDYVEWISIAVTVAPDGVMDIHPLKEFVV